MFTFIINITIRFISQRPLVTECKYLENIFHNEILNLSNGYNMYRTECIVPIGYVPISVNGVCITLN